MMLTSNKSGVESSYKHSFPFNDDYKQLHKEMDKSRFFAKTQETEYTEALAKSNANLAKELEFKLQKAGKNKK